MKPAPFDYIRVDSVEEAVELLSEYGDDARIIAGGQSLMPMLNMRLARPEVLIDIARVPELSGIKSNAKALEIGAVTTQGALQERDALSTEIPIVAQALPSIGHFQTRNRGTVCGSLCHADPSSELPLCLALLGGEVELRSKRGTRRLAADDFQIGVLTTAKEPDELATCAIFPKAAEGSRFAFAEFHRRHGDFAIVAVAAMRSGSTVRLAVGGVADRPEMREWQGLESSAIDDALNDFAWDLGGSDDIHSTARHRRELVRHMGRRVIEETAR